jgi:hypothetical protein
MATRYAVNAAEHVEPRFFLGARRSTPHLKIRGAYPVVRRAILAKHRPVLKAEQAELAGDILGGIWPQWQRDYLECIAAHSARNINALEVAEDECVRKRYDGKTPMIDLPRVRSTSGGYAFDQRNCVALCVEKEFSSKIWTRVGRPQNLAPCQPHQLRDVTERYRQQASATGNWFYDQFFEATAEAFRKTQRRRDTAMLEVTTVGLRVDGHITDEDADAWLFDGNAPNLDNEQLWEYLRSAASLDQTLADLQSTEHRWLAMPAALQTADGMIVSRRVLYLSRPVDDIVQIVGIALDDSANAELANDVALKLSRFIANGI